MKISTLISPLSILLFFSFVIIIKCRNTCPPEQDITPCSCLPESSELVSIKCANMHSEQELSRVFRNLNWYAIGTFGLYNSSMKYLPEDIFKDVRTTVIQIENSVFNQLFQDVPQDPGVLSFRMIKVRVLGSWDWKPFTAFKTLVILTVSDTPMRGLSNFKQYTPKGLKQIYIRMCQVKKLQKDMFQDLLELEYIDILGDTIKELKRSMFARPSKLKEMRFDNNQIPSIPDDLFEDMNFPKVVSFKFNQLTVLPENLSKLRLTARMYFDGNLLECNCGLKWVALDTSQAVSGTCDSPQRIKGKKIRDLTAQDFEFC